MEAKEELKARCFEAWSMLKIARGYYGEESTEARLWRARWSTYQEAYFIVYGEVLIME